MLKSANLTPPPPDKSLRAPETAQSPPTMVALHEIVQLLLFHGVIEGN